MTPRILQRHDLAKDAAQYDGNRVEVGRGARLPTTIQISTFPGRNDGPG
jgi:hypothetical protein